MAKRELLFLAVLSLAAFAPLAVFIAVAPSPAGWPPWADRSDADRMEVVQALTGVLGLPAALLAIALAMWQLRLTFPRQVLGVRIILSRNPDYWSQPEERRGAIQDDLPMMASVEISCLGAITQSWSAEFTLTSPDLGWAYRREVGSVFPSPDQSGPWYLTMVGFEKDGEVLRISREGGTFFPNQSSWSIGAPVRGFSCDIEGRWWTERASGRIAKQRVSWDAQTAVQDRVDRDMDDNMYCRFDLTPRRRWPFT
jgi:hypothetical protein